MIKQIERTLDSGELIIYSFVMPSVRQNPVGIFPVECSLGGQDGRGRTRVSLGRVIGLQRAVGRGVAVDFKRRTEFDVPPAFGRVDRAQVRLQAAAAQVWPACRPQRRSS